MTAHESSTRPVISAGRQSTSYHHDHRVLPPTIAGTHQRPKCTKSQLLKQEQVARPTSQGKRKNNDINNINYFDVPVLSKTTPHLRLCRREERPPPPTCPNTHKKKTQSRQETQQNQSEEARQEEKGQVEGTRGVGTTVREADRRQEAHCSLLRARESTALVDHWFSFTDLEKGAGYAKVVLANILKVPSLTPSLCCRRLRYRVSRKTSNIFSTSVSRLQK